MNTTDSPTSGRCYTVPSLFSGGLRSWNLDFVGTTKWALLIGNEGMQLYMVMMGIHSLISLFNGQPDKLLRLKTLQHVPLMN